MEKKIEEMAEIIDLACDKCKATRNCEQCEGYNQGAKCLHRFYAKHLIEQGYRKVEQGEWKPIMQELNYCDTLECSSCGFVIDISLTDYNYCPNCGARMKGEK